MSATGGAGARAAQPRFPWLAAARPRTLTAAVVPVAVGLAAASRTARLDLVTGVVTLVAALLIQIATNLANDYFDFASGTDTAERLGPLRVTQAGVLTPQAVRRAAFAVLALAGLAGLYLVTIGGWPIALVGVASLISAVAYSAGPWSFAARGLGDVFVFAFFGVVAVTGTAFLQTAALDALTLVASLPVGCLATAILAVNNLRDLPTDQRAGKRTLAVRIGEAAARREYFALVAGAFLAVPLLAWLGGAPLLVCLAALPLGVREARAVARRSGAALNQSLAGTARLELVFGLLLALGLVL